MNLTQLLNPSYDYKVEVALFELAQRNAITGVAAPILVPVLIALNLGETLDARNLAIWLSLMVCTALSGLLNYFVLNARQNSGVPTKSRLLAWRRANLFYLLLVGIGWGAIGILLVPAHLGQNALLLLFFLAVMTAGANISAVHSYRSYLIAVAIAIIELFWNMPKFGEHAFLLALLLSVYALLIVNGARNAQQAIMQSLQSQFLNEQAALAAERERIYRDLHDDVGAKLLGLAISAQRSNHARDADLALSALQDLRDVVSRSPHAGMRLDHLLADMRAENVQRAQAANIELRWYEQGCEIECTVNPAAAINLSRLLREAVSNVLRHARATQLDIGLAVQADCLVVTVRDDGVGLPETGFKSGRGMEGMLARAKLLGGNIRWEAVSPGGCGVTLQVSLPHLTGAQNTLAV